MAGSSKRLERGIRIGRVIDFCPDYAGSGEHNGRPRSIGRGRASIGQCRHGNIDQAYRLAWIWRQIQSAFPQGHAPREERRGCPKDIDSEKAPIQRIERPCATPAPRKSKHRKKPEQMSPKAPPRPTPDAYGLTTIHSQSVMSLAERAVRRTQLSLFETGS